MSPQQTIFQSYKKVCRTETRDRPVQTPRCNTRSSSFLLIHWHFSYCARLNWQLVCRFSCANHSSYCIVLWSYGRSQRRQRKMRLWVMGAVNQMTSRDVGIVALTPTARVLPLLVVTRTGSAKNLGMVLSHCAHAEASPVFVLLHVLTCLTVNILYE